MKDRAAALAASDSQAWSDLYDDLADRLFHYALLQVQDHEIAAEALQQGFVSLYESRSKLTDVGDVDAYAFTILRNKLHRYFRDERKHKTQSLESVAVFEADFDDPKQRLSLENTEWIAANLQKLSRGDREMIQLKVFSEMTFAQIAKITDLPPGTVASRYRRAVAKLATQWKEDSQ